MSGRLRARTARGRGPARWLWEAGRPLRGRFAIAVLLGAATVGSSVALMATSAWLIAHAALRPSIAELSLAIVGVRAFGLLRGLARYGERLVAHDATFRLLARLRVALVRALAPLAPARLEDRRSGDLLARLLGDVEALEHAFVRGVTPALVALATGILLAVVLATISPSLSLVALAFFAASAVAPPWIALRGSRRAAEARADHRARLGAAAVDLVQGLPDLVAFGRAEEAARRIGVEAATLAADETRLARVRALATAGQALAGSLAVAAVLATAVGEVASGALPGVLVAVAALTTGAAFEATAGLTDAAQQLTASRAAAGRLVALDGEPPAVEEPARPAPPPDRFDLELTGVSYAYPGARGMALAGIDLTVPAGARVALVGPSGGGKSTLLDLLLRFRDPLAGRIVLGGRPLKDYRGDDVRRAFAVVAQHPFLFTGTIRDNLRLARPEASDAEIVCAAVRASVHDWISSLPEAYETRLGEGGLTVSGGERQRLALARGLLADAPILLLDEPTASLDAVTETAVRGGIDAGAVGHTLLVVTHRLVGMERYDEIVVLDRGRVADRGTHGELMARPGLYRSLVARQRGEAALEGLGKIAPEPTVARAGAAGRGLVGNQPCGSAR